MKKLFLVVSILLGSSLVLAACAPHTFSPPYQVHATASDHMTTPAIAIDAAGVSHIAGVVGSNVVYYRTVFGPALKTVKMTLPGSGANFVQFQPDIAVTDDGTAYMVWFEQWGTTDRSACYQVFPAVEPAGGYQTTCTLLLPGYDSVSNLMIVAKGNRVYALFDRINPFGSVDALIYKDLVYPSVTGFIYSYTNAAASGIIHDWDAGIDANGHLHVAILETVVTGLGPSSDHLTYRSNRSTYSDGTMEQHWFMNANAVDTTAGTSLAFTTTSSGEFVNVAGVIKSGGMDEIRIFSCTTGFCTNQNTSIGALPTSWTGVPAISAVEIASRGHRLALAYTGNDGNLSFEQVYSVNAGFGSSNAIEISGSQYTYKADLSKAVLTTRPGSDYLGNLEVFSWAESYNNSVQYYSEDGYNRVKVFDRTCPTASPIGGDVAAHGTYYAGVWEACGETWHSAWADQISLPIVTK